MINGKTVLGIVVARGGSKGLPGKNVADCNGRPVIAWTIDAAKASATLDRTIVSTDSREIADVAIAAGGDVPGLRPTHLATDEARVTDVITDILSRMEGDFDYLVLLQATSPLRTAAHIDGAVDLCDRLSAPACVSVTESSKPIEWMFRVGSDHRLVPALSMSAVAPRRQELPAAYSPNGAVYVATTEAFKAEPSFYRAGSVAYEMDAESSVDIDDSLSLDIVRLILSRRGKGSEQ